MALLLRRSIWFSLVLSLPLAAGCGRGNPSVTETEAVLRPLIEEGQADRVELVEFHKVKDESGEFGVPFYLIEYLARVEFELDSFLEFSSERPYVRAYPLTPPRPACEPDAKLDPNSKVWKCVRVKKGDKLKLEGTFRFEKGPKGWEPVRAEWLDPNKMVLEEKK